MPQDRVTRRRRALRGAALAAALVAAGGALIARPQESGDPIGDARAALAQWVETRRQIAKVRSDWAVSRELLEDRVAVVQRQIEQLRAQIAEADVTLAQGGTDRVAQQAEREKHDFAAEKLRGVIGTLEGRVQALLERLPQPLLDRTELVRHRLPADPAKSDASLSDRFATVVAILNEADKFQREITEVNEVRKLPDGSSAEVTTIYLGLGQAFWVTRDGLTGGTGAPGPDGWVWSASPDAPAALAAAVTMLKKKGEVDATYVQLPIRIQ